MILISDKVRACVYADVEINGRIHVHRIDRNSANVDLDSVGIQR